MRAFKTGWFSKAARKARISDRELYEAILEILRGQADDLGGGVFKKRLDRNRHRSIVLTRAGRCWFYVYLFAKKDRANIAPDELVAFRKLAKTYAEMSEAQLATLVEKADLEEIFDGSAPKLQE